MKLPSLKSVDIKLDASEDIVWVNATPVDETPSEALKLEDGLEMPKSIQFAIDLKLQGPVRIIPSDLTHTYDGVKGILAIDVDNVDLSDDYKHKAKKNLRLALQNTMRKLGSFRSILRRRSSKK